MQTKNVVITGAASGIGLECVRKLLEEGAGVGAIDIQSSSELEELKAKYGSRLSVQLADISVEDKVQNSIQRIRADLASVTDLVCAAGILSSKPFRETSLEHWRKVFSVNVEGVMLCMSAVIEEMIARKSGSIVLVSSQLVNGGGRNNAAYIASKSALIGLTRTTALEFAPFKVRVNAILPGVVDTPMHRIARAKLADPETHSKNLRARHPLNRIANPGEVADGILYMLSDKADFMTGAELVLDGGWSIA